MNESRERDEQERTGCDPDAVVVVALDFRYVLLLPARDRRGHWSPHWKSLEAPGQMWQSLNTYSRPFFTLGRALSRYICKCLSVATSPIGITITLGRWETFSPASITLRRMLMLNKTDRDGGARRRRKRNSSTARLAGCCSLA